MGKRSLPACIIAGVAVALMVWSPAAEAQSQRYKTGAGQPRQSSERVSGGGALTTNSLLLTGVAAAIVGGIIAVAVDEDDDGNRTTGAGITATSTN